MQDASVADRVLRGVVGWGIEFCGETTRHCPKSSVGVLRKTKGLQKGGKVGAFGEIGLHVEFLGSDETNLPGKASHARGVLHCKFT